MTKVNAQDMKRLVTEWTKIFVNDKTTLEMWLEAEDFEIEAFKNIMYDMTLAHGLRMKKEYGEPWITRPKDIDILIEMAIRFGYEMHKQFKGSNEL